MKSTLKACKEKKTDLVVENSKFIGRHPIGLNLAVVCVLSYTLSKPLLSISKLGAAIFVYIFQAIHLGTLGFGLRRKLLQSRNLLHLISAICHICDLVSIHILILEKVFKKYVPAQCKEDVELIEAMWSKDRDPYVPKGKNVFLWRKKIVCELANLHQLYQIGYISQYFPEEWIGKSCLKALKKQFSFSTRHQYF